MIYIIDNGMDYSDNTLFFVSTDKPLWFVKALVELFDDDHMIVAGTTAALKVFSRNSISTTSLDSLVDDSYIAGLHVVGGEGYRARKEQMLREYPRIDWGPIFEFVEGKRGES